jgi:hypothetical protein
MKFLQYIQEEYFTRLSNYEIFKNPSQKEVSNLYNKSQSIRALVDFDNRVCFMFDSDLLHQSAIKQISKEYNDSGLFCCVEVYTMGTFDNPKMIINIAGGTFKVVGHRAIWIGAKLISGTNWFLDFLKHLPDFKNYKLEEDYISTLVGTHYNKNIVGAIFCNPTGKELQSMKNDYVRFLIDKYNEKIYVWPGDIVHYEVVDKLKKLKLITMDKSYMDGDEFWELYYVGVGRIVGNKIRWTADSDYAMEIEDQSLIDNISDLKWTHKWISWAD